MGRLLQDTNFDAVTQCHFGVISYHSLNQDALADVFDNGRNLTYESAVAEVKANLRSTLSDYFSDYKHGKETSKLDDAVDATFDAIADDWNDGYESSGDEQFLYEQDGYKISNSPSLVCLFIKQSPYYTYTRGCSPCAPNAGDLDNPQDGGLKTLCLGLDWFDADSPCPYTVFRVADDTQVEVTESTEVSQ